MKRQTKIARSTEKVNEKVCEKEGMKEDVFHDGDKKIENIW